MLHAWELTLFSHFTDEVGETEQGREMIQFQEFTLPRTPNKHEEK